MELKPCPFCGSHQVDLFGDDELGWLARCADCRVCTFICDTKAETVAAWNTRAERTCRMVDAYCSECGKPDPSSGDAEYCAYCGAKVVKE